MSQVSSVFEAPLLTPDSFYINIPSFVTLPTTLNSFDAVIVRVSSDGKESDASHMEYLCTVQRTSDMDIIIGTSLSWPSSVEHSSFTACVHSFAGLALFRVTTPYLVVKPSLFSEAVLVPATANSPAQLETHSVAARTTLPTGVHIFPDSRSEDSTIKALCTLLSMRHIPAFKRQADAIEDALKAFLAGALLLCVSSFCVRVNVPFRCILHAAVSDPMTTGVPLFIHQDKYDLDTNLRNSPALPVKPVPPHYVGLAMPLTLIRHFIGDRRTKGMLLVGPLGSGRSALLAQALADTHSVFVTVTAGDIINCSQAALNRMKDMADASKMLQPSATSSLVPLLSPERLRTAAEFSDALDESMKVVNGYVSNTAQTSSLIIENSAKCLAAGSSTAETTRPDEHFSTQQTKFLGKLFAAATELAIKIGNDVILIFEDFDELFVPRTGHATDLQRQLVSTLLKLLDSTDTKLAEAVAPAVRVIGVCTSADKVDISLRRPGRLEYEVELGLPNHNAKRMIVVHRALCHILSDDSSEVINVFYGSRGSVSLLSLFSKRHSETEYANIAQSIPAAAHHCTALSGLAGITSYSTYLHVFEVVDKLTERFFQQTACEITMIIRSYLGALTSEESESNVSLSQKPLFEALCAILTHMVASIKLTQPRHGGSSSYSLVLPPLSTPTSGYCNTIHTGTYDELRSILMLPIEYPRLYTRFLNRNRNKGATLLYGASGTGKTVLIRRLARELSTKLHFFELRCTSVYSMFVGESESNIRQAFLEARRHTPSVLVIEDFDSLVGKSRDSDKTGDNVGHRVLATLLTEIDGVSRAQSSACSMHIIFVSSNPFGLDPAICRPGRMDRRIYCPWLNEAAHSKEAISAGLMDLLHVHTPALGKAYERFIADEHAETVESIKRRSELLALQRFFEKDAYEANGLISVSDAVNFFVSLNVSLKDSSKAASGVVLRTLSQKEDIVIQMREYRNKHT